MNRDDLLKQCVDRRVAHETSVVAVSHLFYVYLLSALKKGQQVEVPNFGTFGTRIVGVKRQRRMPYFEVENDLADKVNERYRNLKTLLVGKYEIVHAEGEVPYEGKEPPYDQLGEKLGKEFVLDTYREITPEKFAEQKPIMPVRTASELPATPRIFEPPAPVTQPPPREEMISEQEPEPAKEKKLMPKLNLRGEGMDDTPPPIEEETMKTPPYEPPPTQRDYSYKESGFSSPLVQILIGVLMLAAVTFLLNHLGWVHFWGTKTPTTTATEETLPPVVQPPPQIGGETAAESTAQQVEPTPIPVPPTAEEKGTEEKPAVATEEKPPVVAQEPARQEPPKAQPPSIGPPRGTGEYTIQVSSWDKRIDAIRIVSRLSKSGIDAYVAEGMAKGRRWYRVRVGRYETAAEAQSAASRVQSISGNGVWVTKVN